MAPLRPNAHGLFGVSPSNGTTRWKVQRGKVLGYIGSYGSAVEAARVHDEKLIEKKGAQEARNIGLNIDVNAYSDPSILARLKGTVRPDIDPTNIAPGTTGKDSGPAATPLERQLPAPTPAPALAASAPASASAALASNPDSDPLSLGFFLLGRPLEVYWPREDQWFRGVVSDYVPSSGRYRVTYEDDDVLLYDLRKEKLRWLDRCSTAAAGSAGTSTAAAAAETMAWRPAAQYGPEAVGHKICVFWPGEAGEGLNRWFKGEVERYLPPPRHQFLIEYENGTAAKHTLVEGVTRFKWVGRAPVPSLLPPGLGVPRPDASPGPVAGSDREDVQLAEAMEGLAVLAEAAGGRRREQCSDRGGNLAPPPTNIARDCEQRRRPPSDSDSKSPGHPSPSLTPAPAPQPGAPSAAATRKRKGSPGARGLRELLGLADTIEYVTRGSGRGGGASGPRTGTNPSDGSLKISAAVVESGGGGAAGRGSARIREQSALQIEEAADILTSLPRPPPAADREPAALDAAPESGPDGTVGPQAQPRAKKPRLKSQTVTPGPMVIPPPAVPGPAPAGLPASRPSPAPPTCTGVTGVAADPKVPPAPAEPAAAAMPRGRGRPRKRPPTGPASPQPIQSLMVDPEPGNAVGPGAAVTTRRAHGGGAGPLSTAPGPSDAGPSGPAAVAVTAPRKKVVSFNPEPQIRIVPPRPRAQETTSESDISDESESDESESDEDFGRSASRGGGGRGRPRGRGRGRVANRSGSGSGSGSGTVPATKPKGATGGLGRGREGAGAGVGKSKAQPQPLISAVLPSSVQRDATGKPIPFGPEIVGRKVSLLVPPSRQFLNGTIVAYDPSTRMHQLQPAESESGSDSDLGQVERPWYDLVSPTCHVLLLPDRPYTTAEAELPPKSKEELEREAKEKEEAARTRRMSPTDLIGLVVYCRDTEVTNGLWRRAVVRSFDASLQEHTCTLEDGTEENLALISGAFEVLGASAEETDRVIAKAEAAVAARLAAAAAAAAAAARNQGEAKNSSAPGEQLQRGVILTESGLAPGPRPVVNASTRTLPPKQPSAKHKARPPKVSGPGKHKAQAQARAAPPRDREPPGPSSGPRRRIAKARRTPREMAGTVVQQASPAADLAATLTYSAAAAVYEPAAHVNALLQQLHLDAAVTAADKERARTCFMPALCFPHLLPVNVRLAPAPKKSTAAESDSKADDVGLGLSDSGPVPAVVLPEDPPPSAIARESFAAPNPEGQGQGQEAHHEFPRPVPALLIASSAKAPGPESSPSPGPAERELATPEPESPPNPREAALARLRRGALERIARLPASVVRGQVQSDRFASWSAMSKLIESQGRIIQGVVARGGFEALQL